MEVNGWKLYQHPIFRYEYEKLLAEVGKLAQAKPDTYESHKSTKLLKRITDLITEDIPSNPADLRFNQGKTLGAGYQHWKRAKFGNNQRYRLFFRYEQKKIGDKVRKVIIYAWLSAEGTIRKAGDKNDPYALFAKGLKNSKPPDSIDALLNESEELTMDSSSQDQ